MQAVYVVASDQPDRFDWALPLIRQAAGYADEVYSESAAKTGGVRHLRWVTNADCTLAVERVVGPPTVDDSFSATREYLRTLGYQGPERNYVMWVDAALYCGIATVPEDDRSGVDNESNVGGHYARIDTTCWNYVNSIEAHEITHMLGGVQLSAPHSNGTWHCTDDSDLLCYDDGSGSTQPVCDSVQESFLDCNNDDYFHTAPETGSYLGTHWNVADSVYLARVSGEYPVMPSAETWTWSGTLSRKVSEMSHAADLATGNAKAQLSFTKAKSMRLALLDPNGTVVAITQGRSPLTLSKLVTDGRWTYRVDGATSGTYSLTVDGWRSP